MKQIYWILACFCSLTMASCGDMLEDIQPYLDKGEKIYVGKLDSISVLSGKNRIKIVGYMPYGTTQTQCAIHWLNPMGERGIKEFPVNRSNDVDEAFEFLFDNLLEGQYDFRIYTQDALGNSSIRVDRGGYSYGEVYQNSLYNREIDQITSEEVTIDGNLVRQATIQWKGLNNIGAQGCHVEYETLTGDAFGTIYVPIEESTTNITGYKPNGIVRWETTYLPDSASIDVFKTPMEELLLPENNN